MTEPARPDTGVVQARCGARAGLVGEIVSRIEAKGLTLGALELRRLDEATARKHYAEHDGKPFFGDLVSFITGGPLVAMVVEGPEAWKVMRTLMGSTNPREAAPGTIRGDLAVELTENLVHGSDGPGVRGPRNRPVLPRPLLIARSVVTGHLAQPGWRRRCGSRSLARSASLEGGLRCPTLGTPR